MEPLTTELEAEAAARAEDRRRARPILWVAFGLISLLYAGLVVQDGLASRELAAGRGIQGTFTIDNRARESDGRGPDSWYWAGVFRSDDGSVVIRVRSKSEGPTPDDHGSPRGTGRWHIGDQVRAQWVSQAADRVYAPRAGNRNWWIETSLWLAIPTVIVVIGLLVARRFRRKYPNGWRNPMPPPPPHEPPPLSQREQDKARRKATQQDLNRLKAELAEIERQKRTRR